MDAHAAKWNTPVIKSDIIHVFVGTAANHEDIESQAVLEYTLRKYSSQPIEITWMMQSRDVTSPFYTSRDGGWATQNWATPFSGFRWGIPFVAKSLGIDRAIYMDSDFIVFADIAELWNTEFRENKAVIALSGSRFCCSMWNTEQALLHLPKTLLGFAADPSQHSRMSDFYNRHQKLIQLFDTATGDWNYMDFQAVPLDQLAERNIKAIHYTRMEQQLQLKYALPRLAATGGKHWYDRGETRPHDWPALQELFDGLLTEATDAGYGLGKYEQFPTFGKYRIRGAA